MRALYLVTTTRRIGGLEKLFYNCILNKDFFKEVYFACFFPPIDDSLREFYLLNGVKYFIERHITHVHNLLLYYPRTWISLFFFIKKKRIEVIHVHDNLSMLFAVAARFFVKIRIIRTHHGAINDYSNRENKHFRLVKKWVDLNIFVSASFRHTYLKMNRIREEEIDSRVIYNGIFVEDILSFPKEMPQNGIFRLIMVGNYSGGRDQLFVIKSMHQISKYYPQCTLKLIGNINEREDSKVKYKSCVDYVSTNELDNKVEFIHNVNEILPYLALSDVFIYQSTRDTFGVAIVEAMMCGLPCIINDLDVFQEISNDGELAILFKTGDVDDCTKKVLQVLNNYQEYYDKAQENVKKVRERYSIERYAKNLMEIYEEVAEGKKH